MELQGGRLSPIWEASVYVQTGYAHMSARQGHGLWLEGQWTNLGSAQVKVTPPIWMA